MTLTTVGHIDKVTNGHGEAWEVAVSLLVVVGCTIVYTYVTANVTAMMLRFYQQLERYRSRVQRVDNYLRRNHVRSRLRKLVREHFRRLYDNENNGNDAMLSEMPLSLRFAARAHTQCPHSHLHVCTFLTVGRVCTVCAAGGRCRRIL